MWSMLCEKEDKTGEVSLGRWDTDALLASMGGVDVSVCDRIRFGAFLSDSVIGVFDGSVFGISAAEAESMDPNQRLLMAVSYEAFLDAGHTMSSLRGSKAGVFVGASGSIGKLSCCEVAESEKKLLSVYDATGSSLSVAAGRISYVLGLQGPCSTTDTACSSSLVALHAARCCLNAGDCTFALLAATNIVSEQTSVAFARAGMTSADGKCHSFDEAANGYCRSEGCGAMVLKRLSDAVRDGDSIYAVVRGSAVMQDGRSASLTAPNGLAQEQLMRAALADAGLEAKDVRYLEAHGTGTKLGDPVETGAIAAVYGSSSGRDAADPLLV